VEKKKSRILAWFGAGLSVALAGCATNVTHPYEPQDPVQSFNRAAFAFNDQFDTIILKPVAKGYQTVIPTFVQNRVNDFFWNLTDITSTANNALQFKPTSMFYSGMRFVINSTFGVFGLFDVAGDVGMVRKENDFGTTLAVWGVTSSPYLVVPFIGSTNFRDGIGMGVDLFGLSIWPFVHDRTLRNILWGVDYVRIRANMLKTEGVVQAGALDKYTFVRDAYFQYRQAQLEQNGGTWDQATKYYGANDEDLELDSLDSDTMAVEPPLAGPSLDVPSTGKTAPTATTANSTTKLVATVKSSATATTAPVPAKITSSAPAAS
jgi:phospholipid-binding lipoprotein MlaA